MPNRQNGVPKRNWASGVIGPLNSATGTEFEKVVRRLRLTHDSYLRSEALRRWCEQNRHRCYIPESLLKTWGMIVEPDLS